MGYFVWHLFAAHITIIKTMHIPLSFYNTDVNHIITAPEMVTVTMQAKRTDLNAINMETISIHINQTDLHLGDNFLYITNESLLLPETIQVIHYPCTRIRVTMNREKQTDTLNETLQ